MATIFTGTRWVNSAADIGGASIEFASNVTNDIANTFYVMPITRQLISAQYPDNWYLRRCSKPRLSPFLRFVHY